MNPTTPKAKEIFVALLDNVPEEEWDAYVDEACGADEKLRQRVRALLRAHAEPDSRLEQPPVVIAHPVIREEPGDQIGSYTLLQQIGEGGMGVVYRAAQQEPVRREVALKIVKPGMDTRDVISRFEVERQALAMMNHPNIAKVLGAGSTESGRLYFVMELVEGVPLTEYADRNQLNTRQRLELFRTVCEAVQHAHQKGIIHRDIKPSNVLVASDDGGPIPKIIDFGIAKAVKDELSNAVATTGHGQIMGTPLYMSPEQAGLDGTDVDTRTDIYSLGVVLYELLAGTTPFDEDRLREASYEEVRRLIREEEPPSPSAVVNTLGKAATTISSHRQVDPHKLHRLLRGELDWIVIKALEKDRDRRYATASSLARDIQSYLDDEPVEACPPSRLYQFQKLARRNKGMLAGSLIVATSLIVGAGVAVWKSIEATRERDRTARISEIAERERNNTELARAESEELATLGLEVLDDIYLDVLGDRLARNPEVTAEQRRLLQSGLDYYERFVKRSQRDAESDLVIARAHRQIGLIYGRLGDRQREASYRQAMPLYERLAEQSPDVQFRLALVLGGLLENQAALGQIEQAKESGARAIEILEQLCSTCPDQPDYGMALAGTHNRLAWALVGVLPPRDIELHHRTAIRLFEELAEKFPEARLEGELPYDDPLDGAAHSRLHLAQVLRDTETTSQLQLAAFQHFQAKVAGNPRSQWHRAQLADISLSLSGENVRRGVELLEELHSEFPSVPRHKYRLAFACERLGRVLGHDSQKIKQSEQHLRRAVQLLTELVRDYPNTPDYQSHLAAALDGLLELPRTVVDPDEARQLIDLAIGRQTDAVDANPKNRKYREYLADHYGSLAEVLEELGESESVDESHLRRIELLDVLRDEDAVTYESQSRQSRLDYADWLTRHGDYEDAKTLYRELIVVCGPGRDSDEQDPGTQSLLGAALHGLGNVFLASRELDDALPAFQQAIEHQESALLASKDHGRCRELLCRHLCRLGTAQSELGQEHLARTSWNKAIEIFKDLTGTSTLAAQEDVAWVLVRNSKAWAPATVIAIAEDALARSPFSRPLWTALGAARCRSGKWLEAAAALDEANRLGGSDSCNSFFLAIANWQLGERATAGDWYEQAVENLPVHGIWHEELQRVREEANASLGPAILIRGAEQQEGTGGQATEFVFAITRFGDTSGSIAVDWSTSDGTARAGRDYVPVAGQLHLPSGVGEQRISVAVYPDFMVEPTEDFVVSLVDVAGAEVAQRRAIGTIVNDDEPESIDKWQRTIKYRDDSPVAHFKRAVAYFDASEHDSDALADLSRAIELAPDFAKAHFVRSVTRQRLGEVAPALVDVEQAISLGYQSAASFNNRGVLRSLASTSNAEAALADFDRAIKIGPPTAEFYNNRGVVHAQRGAMDEAVGDFDEAVRLCPDLAAGHANLAIARAANGQLGAALDGIRQLAVQAAEEIQDDSVTCQWVTAPDLENESLRRFRDEAVVLIRSAATSSTEENGANYKDEKGAGEPSLPTTKLTGQPSLRRLVCTPGKMTMAIVSQTINLTKLEHQAMTIAQMKKRLQDRRRQLRLETLEQRNLLTGTISGTVFEDVNGDGVQDVSEVGMAESIVVLERTDTDTPLLTIDNPRPGTDDAFGFSIAGLGDDIIVGAPNDDSYGTDAGAAYLFDGTSADLRFELKCPDPGDLDKFGTSVQAVGENILVGTRRDWIKDSHVTRPGAAYLFDGSTGEYLRTFLDPNPDLSTKGNFSGAERGVAASGNNVLISASHADVGSVDVGAVYLFNASNGEVLRTFANPTPDFRDNFGFSVAAFGDYVLVGADFDDTGAVDAGAAYLFDGTDGQLLRTFLNPTPEAGDQFGFSVAGVDDLVIISAEHDSTGGINAGAVYVFNASTGELLQTLLGPASADDHRFGSDVNVIGDKVLVSDDLTDSEAIDSGIAHLYDIATGELLQTLNNPMPGIGEQFARIAAFAGDKAIIPDWSTIDGVVQAGSVHLFDLVESTKTGTAGNYSFTGLDAGTYDVRQIVSDGYIQTAPGGDGTYTVPFDDGDNVTGYDFGNQFDSIVLFADSFENGQLDGLWVQDNQNDWFASSQRSNDGGSYSAEVDGRATDAMLTVANSIDMTLYGGAELTFDWFIENGLDAGEYLALDLFDGADWNQEALISGNVDPENAWQQVTIDVDGAYLVSNFQFRFRAKMSGSREDANVDNVQLVATSLSGPANNAPVAGNDVAVTTEDNPVMIDVLGNDEEIDPGDVLQIQSVAQGADGTVAIVGDQVSYTPNADFNGGDYFYYTVSDGRGGTDTALVTVTVAPVADAPDAADDYFTATADEVLSIDAPGVLDGDYHPDDIAFSAEPIDGGATAEGGQVTLNSDGSFTYTPQAGFVGTDTFSYTITDGSATDTATVSIELSAVTTDTPFYVYDIDFESKSGGKFWRAVFEIRSDSNDIVGPDAGDLPVAGAAITVKFAGNTYTGTTGSDGIFRTGYIKGLGTGSHFADVVDLAMADYYWDSLMDLEDDDTLVL